MCFQKIFDKRMVKFYIVSVILRANAQKISYPTKESYESENLGPRVVFDGENFCRKYFLIQPLGGSYL
jgi:hypothetical protein